MQQSLIIPKIMKENFIKASANITFNQHNSFQLKVNNTRNKSQTNNKLLRKPITIGNVQKRNELYIIIDSAKLIENKPKKERRYIATKNTSYKQIKLTVHRQMW